MKTPKITRYRLGVSRTFPITHKRKGEETFFVEKIAACILQQGVAKEMKHVEFEPKLHTLRSNYELWAKRIEKVQSGLAVIELFYWEVNPYNSKQIVFATLDKVSGCGVQKLTFSESGINYPIIHRNETETYYPFTETIAKNDGLSLEDFKEWFRKYDISSPLAIIHLTKFRY